MSAKTGYHISGLYVNLLALIYAIGYVEMIILLLTPTSLQRDLVSDIRPTTLSIWRTP